MGSLATDTGCSPRILVTLTVAVFTAVTAAAISFALCPLVARLAAVSGAVSLPVSDRWHRRPTPLLGGVAIAAGTVIGAWAFAGQDSSTAILLGTAAGGLILGLIDDKFTLSPTAKLVGTLVLGAGLVYLLNQFATRPLPAPLVVLTVVWFASIVHAVNILDNLDGLAGGVCGITALGTGFILLQAGVFVPRPSCSPWRVGCSASSPGHSSGTFVHG